MIKDSGHSQTVKVVSRENICTSKGTKLLSFITNYRDRNMQRKYLQVHLFGVMFHGGPV